MLVSPAKNDYSTSTTPSSSASQSFRARIRTLNVCEPSFPSRDVVRQQNYARRKAQEFQGWACPRTISYRDLGPAHVPPLPSKPIINDRPTNVTSAKPASSQASSGNVSNRRKSTFVVQDENLMRAQFEANFQRLQTAYKEHMKKSSYILRHVQLGRGVKDIVEKYTPDSSRMKSADINGLPSVKGDEKERSVSYDTLRDDFDEEDDIEVSTVSGIREDIMSPRTTIGSNKHHPVGMSIIPMKLSQSAPPMMRNKIPQETLRLFTPCYSGLSETLSPEEKMLIRDALYRQLCCILWLLRSMGRPEWLEKIGGCWNIAQWMTTDPGPHANHHNQPVKNTQESIKKKQREKTPRSEDKPVSKTKTPKENTIPSVRTASVPAHKSRKKQNSTNESIITRLLGTSLDSQSGSNTLGDATERLDLTINSINIDSDLNESISSKSIQEDTTDNTSLDTNQQSIHPPLTTAISIDPTTNTSRTSLSSNFSQPIGHRLSARLKSIMERRRSPDVLLKKWIERQTITTNNSDQPLAEKDLRLLRVGDISDLNRIFGLENATSTNKEQERVRETREIERKLVTNVKRRPATSVGFTQAKLHAQNLYKIRRDFNEFNEEQSTILNNKLEQADNSRLFYYQTKLDLVQKTMLPKTKSSEKDKPVVIIDRLFRTMRFDKAKKEENAVYLKYQPWYVDLSKMIQKEYKGDYIISLLLDEIKEFSDPLHKPTDIRFKAVLRKLGSHEICHPDIMAAIQFISVHVIKMEKGELKKFFRKQFPTVTIYVRKSADNEDDDDSEDADDNEDDDDSDETICEP